MNYLNKTTLLSLTATVLLSASASASADYATSKNYSKTYGNSNVGCKIYTNGVLGFDNYSGQASVEVGGKMMLLGKTVEAAKFQMAGDVSVGGSSSSGKLRVLGMVVYTAPAQASATATKVFSASADCTLDLFATDPKSTFSVGPFPITIKGNAGAVAEVGASLTLIPTEGRIVVGGEAATYLQAWASASTGVPGFELGVKVIADLAKQTLIMASSSGAGVGMTGAMDLELVAITIKLQLYLESFFYDYAKTIAKFTFGTSEIKLLEAPSLAQIEQWEIDYALWLAGGGWM